MNYLNFYSSQFSFITHYLTPHITDSIKTVKSRKRKKEKMITDNRYFYFI